jgi:chlorobactene glucosyltransferase
MGEELGGRVSVIIPARNEEANIARAVRSAAGQQGVREIIVVDDGSTDRTRVILGGLRREIPVLRALRADALPEGWTGKSHAVTLGARAAAGEWLLFTDADTEHRPGSLAALLERAEAAHADLLSISPGQRTPTWWEKSVIPLVYVHLARLYRFEDVSNPDSPVAAANGQYVLIRREAYQRAGGHEAVRGEILEDVALARRVKASGGMLLFLPGAAWAETRMYRTFADMWQGWTKNLYLLYGGRTGRIAAALVEVAFLDVIVPLLFLASCAVFLLGLGKAWAALAAAVLFVALVERQGSYSTKLGRLGFEPTLASFLFPGAALFTLLLIKSTLAYRLKHGVVWKGRTYTDGKQGMEGK